MATSSSKKKTGSAKKPAAAPKKQPAKKQPAAAPAPAPTAPTWPYAIVCIVLSLLAFLGLFHAEGVIIDGFAGFLSGIMGWGYWAFPFAMLLLAWVFVRNPERHFGLRVTASLLIAPLFGTIVHLMVCRVPFTAQTFGAIVGQLYDGGKALASGGVISGGVGYLLKAGISVYAALPLVHNGNIIENFHFVIKDGRIVDVHAEKGEDILKAAIAEDEGASYFGEVALVPYDSPISNQKILFYNTLFDENAACHLAFGEAYPECVKGGEAMSKEELKAAGLNDSNTHVDFMVGTADLSIIGTTKDGREIPVFVNGNFAL